MIEGLATAEELATVRRLFRAKAERERGTVRGVTGLALDKNGFKVKAHKRCPGRAGWGRGGVAAGLLRGCALARGA